MSELKEHQFCESDEFFREYHGPLSNETHLYYLKSEADKVIADLTDKLQKESALLKETRDFLIESQKMHMRCANNAMKIIRHSNHKRCVAMARWCEAEAQKCLTQQGAMIGFPWTDRFQYLQWQITHYSRWHRIWLKLAEKFKDKEAK